MTLNEVFLKKQILKFGQRVSELILKAFTTNSQENLYAYKMEGLTDKRIENGKSRIIQFLNLRQGNYVLTVYGTNSEGKWNKKGVTIKIKVLPPWWKSRYAYLLYILF